MTVYYIVKFVDINRFLRDEKRNALSQNKRGIIKYGFYSAAAIYMVDK